MYMGNRWILPILLALFISTNGICAIATCLALRSIKSTAHPVSGLSMCTPLTDSAYNWVAWAALLLFELVAFILAAKETWFYVYRTQLHGRTSAMRLLEVMFRDSSVYFLLTLLAYTANVVLSSCSAPASLERILDGPVLSLISILATRMILNARDVGTQHRTSLNITTVVISTEYH